MRRFRELDGLRGIAAILVVLAHLTFGFNTIYREGPPAISMEWGQFGVQLFFLISGFVILMTARRAQRPSDFVISRVSRLYPVYWLAVTESLLLVSLFDPPQGHVAWWEKILNYTMVQRLIRVENVDQVYWTLAIEVQFYVIVFFLLWVTRCHLSDLLLRRFTICWVGVGCAAIVVASVFGHTRGAHPELFPGWVKLLLNATIAQYAPLFAAGMFAFLGRQSEGSEARRHWTWSVSLVLIAAALHVVLQDLSGGLFVLGLSALFLVVALRQKTAVLLFPPLQWFGKISYSLYIGHLILSGLVIHWLWPTMGRPLAMVVAFVVVVVNGALLHYTMEERGSKLFKKWLIALRRRIDGRRTPAPPSLPGPQVTP